MFESNVPWVEYSEPWRQSFAERLRIVRSGDYKVAYLYEHADNSTFRYRAYNVAQALLSADSAVSASYFFFAEIGHLVRISAELDVLVVCRSKYTLELESLVNRMRMLGRKVLFDIDDLVFDVRHVPTLFEVLAVDNREENDWNHWFAYTARLGAAMKLCDGVIATNEYLARNAASFSGLPAYVIPNFMNREQCDYSRVLMDAKVASRFSSDDSIHLAYFSGSPTHRNDYRIAEPALLDLLGSRSDIRIMMVGYLEPSEQLAKYEDRIDRFPFQDFVNLQKLISCAEVNLMPLQNSVFSNSKSALKYFEAAIVGSLSVASPARTFVDAIDNGRTGFIANDHEWGSRIGAVLRLLEDRDAYAAMARDACESVEARFTWSTQAKTIEDVLTGKQASVTAES